MRTGGMLAGPRPRPTLPTASLNFPTSDGRFQRQPAQQPEIQPQPEFARFFVAMRQSLQLSIADVSHWLGTTPEVIVALETGAVKQLPIWPETVRIVSAYASHVRVDAGVLLRMIAAEFEAVVLGQNAPIAAPPQAATPGAMVDHEQVVEGSSENEKGWVGRAAGLMMGHARLVVTLLLLGGCLIVISQPSVLKAASRHLPAPASQFVRSASDDLAIFWAAKREGLTWIEVADPRSRRGDKLQVSRR